MPLHDTILQEGMLVRPLWKDILAAVWLGIIIPGIVLNAFVLKERHRNIIQPSVQIQETQPVGRSILVRDPDGTQIRMDLDNYLTGVLLAEMPGDFHREALKAQSVAARTYTWKAYTTGGKHGDHSVCTDSACCQAYLSDASYLSRGGTQADLDKIRNAVLDTSCFVLLYDGELIDATYFSSSGGSTEAALEVWGTDYPYLRSVFSPEEVRTDTVIFSVEEFQALLETTFSDHADGWFGAVSYTDGGGVDTMEIGGKIYTGVELRSLLGLKSTDIRIRTDGQSVFITTRGYGHRVGMSQYGANTMAENGSTWQQILQHYYPGTILAPI